MIHYVFTDEVGGYNKCNSSYINLYTLMPPFSLSYMYLNTTHLILNTCIFIHMYIKYMKDFNVTY